MYHLGLQLLGERAMSWLDLCLARGLLIEGHSRGSNDALQRGLHMSTRLMSRYFLPLTAFLVAGILAMLSGPSLGFVSRAMMQTTGKRYYCKRCNLKTHREETRESDTDLSGQTDPGFTPWKCWSAFPVNYVTG